MYSGSGKKNSARQPPAVTTMAATMGQGASLTLLSSTPRAGAPKNALAGMDSRYMMLSRELARSTMTNAQWPPSRLPAMRYHLAHMPAKTGTPMMLMLAMAKARSEEHTSELQSRGHLVCR